MPENLVSKDGFSRPVPRQPAHLHTQAESGAYLRDSSQVPRRCPLIYLNRHTPSGQSRVYRVAQLRTDGVHCQTWPNHFMYLFYFLNLIYSRWASTLQSCLWSSRIFPSLPGSRLTIFCRDASSALLQLVNQWLNFTYSRSHALRYGRNNTYSGDKNRTHDFRTSRCAGCLLDHSSDEGIYIVQ